MSGPKRTHKERASEFFGWQCTSGAKRDKSRASGIQQQFRLKLRQGAGTEFGHPLSSGYGDERRAFAPGSTPQEKQARAIRRGHGENNGTRGPSPTARWSSREVPPKIYWARYPPASSAARKKKTRRGVIGR